MSKIAIVTDTNSSMTAEECEKLGVYLMPMPIIIDGKQYFEGVDCSYDHFFEMLANGSEVSTSQPAPSAVTDLWDEALKTHDYIVHIPMSSALSSSCMTANGLAAEYNGRVFVADNKRISISQRESVLDALKMAEAGMEASKIRDTLEEQAFHASIYLAVNTLELLKKSGRVTSAGAAIATVLDIKPVLTIQGEKLDAFKKVRGMHAAEKTMIKAITDDNRGRFAGKNYVTQLAYSGTDAMAEEWRQTAGEALGIPDIEIYRLPLSICCHVGPGVKAVGTMEHGI